MGVSTDAILFYGYCWDEEGDIIPRDNDSETDWQEIILRKRGEVSPWDTAPDFRSLYPDYTERRRQGDAWTAAHRAELDAWYAKKRAVAAEFGVDISRHCSDDCSMPYIAAWSQRVSRGHPERVKLPDVDPAWSERLDRFLATLGIQKPQDKPDWWLVSYWG